MRPHKASRLPDNPGTPKIPGEKRRERDEFASGGSSRYEVLAVVVGSDREDRQRTELDRRGGKVISNRDWRLLEIAVTQTKQRTEVGSNRDKIAGYSKLKSQQTSWENVMGGAAKDDF